MALRGITSAVRRDDVPAISSVVRPAPRGGRAPLTPPATRVGWTSFLPLAVLMIGLSGSSAGVAAERKPPAGSPKSAPAPAEPDASAPAAPSPASTAEKSAPVGEKSAPAGEKPATTGVQTPAAGGKPATPSTKHRLLREGFELTEQLGTFRIAGGRLVFSTEKGGVPLVALENLNLERIARVLADNPTAIGWRISGTATEYRGVNYLLIDRAVLRSSGDPTRP